MHFVNAVPANDWDPYVGTWTGSGDTYGGHRTVTITVAAANGMLTVDEEPGVDGTIAWENDHDWVWDQYKSFGFTSPTVGWYVHGIYGVDKMITLRKL